MKRRKSFIGMLLSLVMVATMFLGIGMADVQAAEPVKYTPYYDAEAGVVKGCPEIGSYVEADTVFSGDLLGEDISLWFYGYDSKAMIEADAGCWMYSIDYGEEFIPDAWGNCDPSYGWIVYDYYYEEEIYYEGTEDEEVYKC